MRLLPILLVIALCEPARATTPPFCELSNPSPALASVPEGCPLYYVTRSGLVGELQLAIDGAPSAPITPVTAAMTIETHGVDCNPETCEDEPVHQFLPATRLQIDPLPELVAGAHVIAFVDGVETAEILITPPATCPLAPSSVERAACPTVECRFDSRCNAGCDAAPSSSARALIPIAIALLGAFMLRGRRR
jgi:hypothetical protein